MSGDGMYLDEDGCVCDDMGFLFRPEPAQFREVQQAPVNAVRDLPVAPIAIALHSQPYLLVTIAATLQAIHGGRGPLGERK